MPLNIPPPPPLQFLQPGTPTVNWNWHDWFQRIQSLAGHLDVVNGDSGGVVTVAISGTTHSVATISFTPQAAHTVFAGPTSGGPEVPTFRALVTSDLPSSVVGSQPANTFYAAPDGAAGVPTFRRIVPTDYEWGMVKKSVSSAEAMTIPSGYQLTAHVSFTISGVSNLNGELWVEQTTSDGSGSLIFTSGDVSGLLVLL